MSDEDLYADWWELRHPFSARWPSIPQQWRDEFTAKWPVEVLRARAAREEAAMIEARRMLDGQEAPIPRGIHRA